jgi:hypothetical protein
MLETIRRLKELRERATKGPWRRADWSVDDGPNRWTIEGSEPEELSAGQTSIWPNGIRKIRVAETGESDNPDDNAAFIVAMENALPEIEEALRMAEQALAPFAERLDRLEANFRSVDVAVPNDDFQVPVRLAKLRAAKAAHDNLQQTGEG